MKKFIIIVFLIFSIKAYAHGTVKILGVEHEKGFIDLKIYLDKDSFLKEELAFESVRKKPSKGETVIPLTKVHEGMMAVVIYHDENSDGELNRGFFWKPQEGFAFSNFYTPKGLPKFKKAAINVIHGSQIVIALNYK